MADPRPGFNFPSELIQAAPPPADTEDPAADNTVVPESIIQREVPPEEGTSALRSDVAGIIKSGSPGLGSRLAFDPTRGFEVRDNSGEVVDNRRVPEGILGHAVDILSRGQFASAGFVDALLSGDGGPAALGRAFAVAGRELVKPEQRLSYRDLIKTSSPGWAAAHPVATTVLGFVGDVALDPTTYLTLGVGASTKFVTTGTKTVQIGSRAFEVGGKTIPLSREGAKVFRQVVSDTAKSGLTGEALRETSNKAFSGLITDPTLSRTLTDAGGAKLFGRNLIGNKNQAALNEVVSDRLGLTRLKKALSNLPGAAAISKAIGAGGKFPGVDTVRRTFNRDADLPLEYVQTRRHLESEMLTIDREVRDEAVDLFGKLSKPQRERVGLLAAKIDDATRAEVDKLGRAVTPEEARGIRDRMVLAEGLSTEEFGVFSRTHQRYQQIGELESQAGILERLLANYTPRRYSVIRDAKGFSGLRRMWFKKLANTFSPNESRQFKNMAEAVEAGYDPVLDASVLYTQRLIESRQAITRKHFNDAVDVLFKGEKSVPDRVKQDITFMGEGIYSRGTLPEVNQYLKLYDGMMGLFRRSATVVRPAFGARQTVSNLAQGFAVLGARAFGAFDPRTIQDSMLLMNGRAAKFELKSTFGQRWSGEEVLNLASEFGIVRGISLEGIGAGTTVDKMSRGVAREIDRIRLAGKVTKNAPAAEGLARFMTGLTRYTSWPAKIEDFGRLSVFMNGLRMGHSPAAAAEVTNKALFDYLHGLSAIESRIIRRVIPFYSFQRFAAPMLVQAAASAPGRIANPIKAAEAFMEGWNKIAGGETLNDSERAAIPGWLLEQPSTFEGLDEKQQAVFRTFNNFSPLDTFSFVRTSDSGEFDTEETLKKGFLAQMTPFIKVPLEFATRKNFFTGRSLPEDMRGARQNVGRLDPDRLLTHMAGIIGAEVSGGDLTGVAGGRLIGSLVGSIPGGSEAILKKAFGWEEGIDPKTGERQVWINPFLVQSFTAINPAMSDAFKVAKEDNTPLERTMQFLFGVGTVKLDLKEQRKFKIKDLERQRGKLVSDIRRAQREGRDESLDTKMAELNEFMEQMGDEATLLTRQDVRGDG